MSLFNKNNKKQMSEEYKKNTVTPLILYKTLKPERSLILKNNKDKSGVYRLRNLKTNKSYVGSAIKLDRRFRDYLSPSFLRKELKKGKSLIYASILKHGYSNFNLDILEYCKPKDVIKLEQKYLDILKPEYNLCQIAGSMLGFKHSEATLIKMRQPKTLDHISKLKTHMKK
jgi:group I intron endonuclease